MNRKMRIDHILHKHLTSHQAAMRRDQRRNRSSFGMMVMNRVKDLPENYDSDEDTSWGPGGLYPTVTSLKIMAPKRSGTRKSLIERCDA